MKQDFQTPEQAAPKNKNKKQWCTNLETESQSQSENNSVFEDWFITSAKFIAEARFDPGIFLYTRSILETRNLLH